MLSNREKTLNWRPGISPKMLDDFTIECIKQLFFDQTGEEYSKLSIQTLPIPEWGGNLLLYDENGVLRGLLWANRFRLTKTRIVAFVIDEDYVSNGYGSEAWNLLVKAAKEDGIDEVQLEVKSSNLRAIKFYEKRGLRIVEDLVGYYKSGPGYVMRGLI